MSSNLREVSRVFERTLDDTPYNSAALIRAVLGKETKSNYGGLCLHQNRVLQGRLASAGFSDSRFLKDRIRKGHNPLVLSVDGALYYTDIYLMSCLPINLDEVLDTDGKKKRFEAYPFIGEEKSYLTISFDPTGRVFRVHKTWPKSQRVDEFEYDLDSEINKVISHEELKAGLYNPVRAHLSIRSLDISSRRCDHLIYLINGNMGAFDEERLYVQTNEGSYLSKGRSLQRFLDALDVIVKHLGGSREEILHFMTESVKLYIEHQP